jgi:hypothetical protein
MKNLTMLILLLASLTLPAQQNDAQQQALNEQTAQIMRNYQLGRPIPGLPDLNRPVHIKKGNMICSNAADLLNPDKATLLYLLQCVVSNNDVQVKIVRPRSARMYFVCYLYGLVEVQVPWAHQKSEADEIHSDWVLVTALSN